MATARLDLSEDAIKPIIAQIRDDAQPETYMILKYESKSKIVCAKTGTGDLDALHEDLSDDEVQYVLFRYEAGDQESKRTKFIFLAFIGPNVGGMTKGRVAAHKPDVMAMIGQSHLQISTDDRDEFTAAQVKDKVKKAAGANYDLGSNASGYDTKGGEIGKSAAAFYKEKEKETTIAPVKYETFARPKETPMDLQGRPMVASATDGMKNTVIRDEAKAA